MPPEASSSARSASSATGGGGRSGLPRPRSISRAPGSARAAAAAPTMRVKYCSGRAANRSGGGPLMPGILARYRPPVPRRMTAFHIAQLNIGRARGAVDGPVMAEFMALLDPVNAVADASPGFVWRLQTEDGNATALRPYEDDRMIVHMSV